MTTRDIEPIDPNSQRGKEIAARLSKTFADVELAIAARKAAEARKARSA